MASYLSRNPVSLKRLVYVDGEQAVIYRALKANPRLGQNFVALVDEEGREIPGMTAE
jgi:hypothetical protein